MASRNCAACHLAKAAELVQAGIDERIERLLREISRGAMPTATANGFALLAPVVLDEVVGRRDRGAQSPGRRA
jgi:hypothetical protein